LSQDLWFQHHIRVRYQETDQMGVVYHANYLNWFEVGRTEMIRKMGLSYRSIESSGLLLPVIEADLKFKKPARYDDIISIYTRIQSFTNVRLEFAYEIRLSKQENEVSPNNVEPLSLPGADDVPQDVQPQGELLVSGVTRHVWVNPSWKPVRIDKEAPDLFQLFQQRG
jgi:acyl-CoA thioester hydrolase